MADKSLISGLPERLFRAQLAFEAKRGRRLTQSVFADLVGVSQATVSDWFKGIRTPSLEQVETISMKLEVNPGWLAFGGKGTDKVENYEPATEPPPGYYEDVTRPVRKVAEPVKRRRGA